MGRQYSSFTSERPQNRQGKVLVLMSTPLIASSVVFLSVYQSLAAGVVGEDPTMNLVVPLLLLVFSQLTALVLIGATFGSVANALRHAPIIQDYMMITGYGVVLFFTATTTTIAGAGSSFWVHKRLAGGTIFLSRIKWFISFSCVCG